MSAYDDGKQQYINGGSIPPNLSNTTATQQYVAGYWAAKTGK